MNMEENPYRAAHALLLEIAEIITGSPMANPRGMAIVSSNSRTALLSNAVAGAHLARLDGTGETDGQQETLMEISSPHIRAMSEDDRKRSLSGRKDELCVAATDSRGLVSHACGDFDDKTMPLPVLPPRPGGETRHISPV